MKKTILLANLITVVALASTTGTIEAYNENEATFVKDAKPTFIAKKTGIKTEVKVKETGFSFGGDFKVEDLKLGKVTKANFLNHSNVWAKYELPELTKGLNIYVKASVSPKFENQLSYKKIPTAESLNVVESEVNELVKGMEVQEAKEKLAKEAEKQGLTFVAKSIRSSTAKSTDSLKALLVTAKKTKIQQNIDAAIKRNKTPKYIDKGSAELEGQVSYKYDALTFGFNSKTNFPLSNNTYNYAENSLVPSYSVTDDYGALVKSTHKIFVESEKDKDVFVEGLKDVKASLEIKHNYAKKVTKARDRVDYVKGNVELAYDNIKDLRIDGKADFTANVNGANEYKDFTFGDYKLEDFVIGDIIFGIPVDFVHSYNAKLTYTGVKNLKLSVAPFVSHMKVNNYDDVVYGTSLKAEYKMLNDKLTLTGKSLLSGYSAFSNNENLYNNGIILFNTNVKYDYNVSDKFTVSPEADAKLDLLIRDQQAEPLLTLTPKVAVEYKPIDSLTLKGSVAAPIKFYEHSGPFSYQETQLKTSLSLKYEWK
ncbi:hypothetical protein [uncultured Sneathia sp.]|uniref:hypothetical protein n=1 Tax=uncultured Sneathia sp. TaxID=278067 RepID=UPI002599CB47|nr:hypothetical protein [uncultured Sneathia sp.]